jgi:cytoskeleton protein RodZ
VPLALGGGGILVVVIALVLWWQGGSGTAPATDTASSAPAADEMDKGQSEPASKPPEQSAAPGEGESEVAPEGPTEPESAPASEPGAMANGRTDQEQADAGPAASVDRLVMTFSGECWLRVTDAEGNDLFEGRRGSGAPLSLTGTAPFSVRLGDVSAVSGVTVNDRDVTVPSGTAGQVVRMSVPRNISE